MGICEGKQGSVSSKARFLGLLRPRTPNLTTRRRHIMQTRAHTSEWARTTVSVADSRHSLKCLEHSESCHRLRVGHHFWVNVKQRYTLGSTICALRLLMIDSRLFLLPFVLARTTYKHHLSYRCQRHCKPLLKLYTKKEHLALSSQDYIMCSYSCVTEVNSGMAGCINKIALCGRSC